MVTFAAGQVVAVQLLPAAAAVTEQLTTGTFALVTVLQVVATQDVAAVSVTGVHEDVGVGPVVAVVHVVAT